MQKIANKNVFFSLYEWTGEKNCNSTKSEISARHFEKFTFYFKSLNWIAVQVKKSVRLREFFHEIIEKTHGWERWVKTGGCKIWEIRNIFLVKAPKNTLFMELWIFIIIILNWTGSFSQIQTHTLKGSILTLFQLSALFRKKQNFKFF